MMEKAQSAGAWAWCANYRWFMEQHYQLANEVALAANQN